MWSLYFLCAVTAMFPGMKLSLPQKSQIFMGRVNEIKEAQLIEALTVAEPGFNQNGGEMFSATAPRKTKYEDLIPGRAGIAEDMGIIPSRERLGPGYIEHSQFSLLILGDGSIGTSHNPKSDTGFVEIIRGIGGMRLWI